MVRSTLKLLVDERGVSLRELARSIDYRFESVRQLYNDEMERYPRDLLSRLCAYFGCSVDRILTIEEWQNDAEIADV